MLAVLDQLDNVVNLQLEHLGVKGLRHVSLGTGRVARHHIIGLGLGRKQYDGYVRGGYIGFQLLTQLYAIHVGHHHV